MKNFLREYFSFTNHERKGILVLSSIIFVLFCSLCFYDSFVSTPQVDFSQFEKEIEEYTANSIAKKSIPEVTENTNYEFDTPGKIERELFEFNPNNLSETEWEKLGLNKKIIHTIKNYEAKGGKFKTKKDLKKIYGLNDGIFSHIEPYILLPDSIPAKPIFKAQNSILKIAIELNSADSLQLLSLPGIGSSFTKRIIKYREQLGGFYNTEQLLDVYGFQKETYDKIQNQIELDVQLIRKININTCEINELGRHPYIKYSLGNLIINYRKQHGNYQAVEDLKKIQLMNDSIYIKLVPYIKI